MPGVGWFLALGESIVNSDGNFSFKLYVYIYILPCIICTLNMTCQTSLLFLPPSVFIFYPSLISAPIFFYFPFQITYILLLLPSLPAKTFLVSAFTPDYMLTFQDFELQQCS